MVDYRKFLKASSSDPTVLPYFGGTRVDAAERRFRLRSAAPLAIGWHAFQLDGRDAVPLGPAAAIELSRPAVRGHYCQGWIVVDGRVRARLAIAPDDEPAALSRVTARTWYSGDHVFDTIDFEDDAELAARDALEHRRALGAQKGVVPSLRAAFGYALGMAVARELEIAMSLPELEPIVVEIADGGPDVVRTLFAELAAARERERAELAARIAAADAAGRVRRVVDGARVKPRSASPERRADDALDQARARMLGCRMLERNRRMDVTYEVDGTRIMSLVDAETLTVLDPGVCLDGEHGVLTLDAMPSVIREAIREHHLNITRRP